jgi:hypothetical protein
MIEKVAIRLLPLCIALVTFTEPLPRNRWGYLAFIWHFPSPHHFTESLGPIPQHPRRVAIALCYEVLHESFSGPFPLRVSELHLPKRISSKVCPELKNNYHLKP